MRYDTFTQGRQTLTLLSSCLHLALRRLGRSARVVAWRAWCQLLRCLPPGLFAEVRTALDIAQTGDSHHAALVTHFTDKAHQHILLRIMGFLGGRPTPQPIYVYFFKDILEWAMIRNLQEYQNPSMPLADWRMHCWADYLWAFLDYRLDADLELQGYGTIKVRSGVFMYQDMRGDDGRIASRRWVFDNLMADDLAGQ